MNINVSTNDCQMPTLQLPSPPWMTPGKWQSELQLCMSNTQCICGSKVPATPRHFSASSIQCVLQFIIIIMCVYIYIYICIHIYIPTYILCLLLVLVLSLLLCITVFCSTARSFGRTHRSPGHKYTIKAEAMYRPRENMVGVKMALTWYPQNTRK